MNTAQIPAELAEQAALERLNEQQQRCLDQTKRLKASLKSLAGNADFEHWFTHYLAADVELKLQQLEKCHVDDLPLARQRWMDAKNMLKDIAEAIQEAQET